MTTIVTVLVKPEQNKFILMTQKRSITNLMFLSLLSRNLPSILTANTLRPLSELISMMVLHVSYNIALPTFLLLSVLVATCKNQLTCQTP